MDPRVVNFSFYFFYLIDVEISIGVNNLIWSHPALFKTWMHGKIADRFKYLYEMDKIEFLIKIKSNLS
jgi:hypothetical protein